MVELFHLGFGVQIFCLLQQYIHAAIFLPSFGNLTYVPQGSKVTISWSHDFDKDDVGYVEWYFIKKNGSSSELLGDNFKGSLNKAKSSLPDISFILPSTLILNNVNLNYSGTYRYVVIARGINPTPRSEVVVIILEQPQAIINCPKSNYLEKGKSFSCLCESRKGNPPPTASWSWENGTVIGETGYLKKNLLLENFSEAQPGTYRCKVHSHNLTDETNITISLNKQPQAIINCPKSIYVEKGKSFSCLCESREGNPPPTASWSWENGTVIGETGYLKKNLSLVNFSEAQSGTYRCKVQSHNLTDETNITISLNTKPTASITCPNQTFVEEGKPFTCLCSAIGGNPTPNASWVKQGENTPKNGLTFVNYTLVFNNIKITDNGTYVCIVESLKLRDEKLMHIFVTYKPRKPELKLNVTHFILGSSVEISCNSDGNPEPKLGLVHNQTISLNYTETNTGIVYIIRRVTYSSSGIYECNAINRLGNSTNRTTLNTTAPTTTPTRARTTNGSGNASVDRDNGGTKWYISIITLFCVILIGVIITYSIVYIRRRKKKPKKTVAPPEYATPEYATPEYATPEYATPSSQSQAAKNNPVYQELNLKDMKKEDNYQALKRNTRSGRNNEAVVENESGYQELNKVREKGDNYQALKRSTRSGRNNEAVVENESGYQELNKVREKGDNYQALKRNTRSGRNNEAVVENESGYQELNKVREKGDNYQALKRNTRSGRNNEAVVENESAYQELNKVREKGDNYQSLNRV